MKLKITAFITLAMSLAMTGTVFAGTWENGSGENSQRWKYNYGNGTYAQNSAGSYLINKYIGRNVETIILMLMDGCCQIPLHQMVIRLMKMVPG